MTKPNDEEGEEVPITIEDPPSRRRLEEEAERAIDGFDAGIVDLLSWLLETETRSRIYVFLRTDPWSTSKEVAAGTGLYPSTVREALADLHADGTVTRRKRESDGAGNNPYEYDAIPPSELIGDMVTQLQDQLNTVFNLDDHLREDEPTSTTDPITISVDDEEEPSEDEGTNR